MTAPNTPAETSDQLNKPAKSGKLEVSDLITIGVLMLLVPGVALTNAMWEIMAGDVYSGISRTTEAILTAAGIALGAALGLWAGQTF